MTECRALNRYGEPVMTFNDPSLAQAYAERMKHVGMDVTIVTTTTRVEEIDVAQFRPKTRLRRVA